MNGKELADNQVVVREMKFVSLNPKKWDSYHQTLIYAYNDAQNDSSTTQERQYPEPSWDYNRAFPIQLLLVASYVVYVMILLLYTYHPKVAWTEWRFPQRYRQNFDEQSL